MNNNFLKAPTPCSTQAQNLHQAAQILLQSEKPYDAGVSIFVHEMRNLLCPLKSGVDLIQHHGNRLSAEKLQRLADVMSLQIKYAEETINDLCKNRAGASAYCLEKKRSKVADLLSQSIAIAEPHIHGKEHQLIVSLPEDLTVLADERCMCQVIANLLINAAKYTPKGGTIRLAARSADDNVIISIEDSGIGIAPENISCIFNLFYQVESSNGDKGAERTKKRSGIGLALAKLIVEAHDGTITAVSGGTGLGSTFIIRMPKRGYISHTHKN